ncbi:MAG: hypothetical protein QF535_09755, partial [Anaerolineales bacterium]|nr:hypothetical protein [Anaerolineales bacterium]
ELILLVVMYFFLLYLSRVSPEVMLYLGLFNMVYYVRIFEHNKIGKYGSSIVKNPVGVFTIVVTAIFVVSVGLEYLIGYFPASVGPLIYNWKMWSVLQFNTLVGTAMMFVALCRLADWGIGHTLIKAESIKSGQRGVIFALIALVMVSAFASERRGYLGEPVTELSVYDWVWLGQQWKDPEVISDVGLIYEEKRVITDLSTSEMKAATDRLRVINWNIVKDNLKEAEAQLSRVNDYDLSYLKALYRNAVANLNAAEGRLHLSHRIYREIEKNFSVGDNEHYIARDSIQKLGFPMKIPNIAFAEAATWIQQNTKQEAFFLNAPHIDGFLPYTRRNSFFPSGKYESDSTPYSPDWAAEYLLRQHDILGITIFDLPGFTYSSLQAAEMRYAFLNLDYRRIEEISKNYPGIDYIFTETGHMLPYKIVFENKYFVIYKLEDTRT